MCLFTLKWLNYVALKHVLYVIPFFGRVSPLFLFSSQINCSIFPYRWKAEILTEMKIHLLFFVLFNQLLGSLYQIYSLILLKIVQNHGWLKNTVEGILQQTYFPSKILTSTKRLAQKYLQPSFVKFSKCSKTMNQRETTV